MRLGNADKSFCDAYKWQFSFVCESKKCSNEIKIVNEIIMDF